MQEDSICAIRQAHGSAGSGAAVAARLVHVDSRWISDRVQAQRLGPRGELEPRAVARRCSAALAVVAARRDQPSAEKRIARGVTWNSRASS